MAAFCRECTVSVLGLPEYADVNDMVLAPGATVKMTHTLCEGCGWGTFDARGQRIPELDLPAFSELDRGWFPEQPKRA